jgi:hypothetical protein
VTAPAERLSVMTRPRKPSSWRSNPPITAADNDDGSGVSPGTDALLVMTAGAPAAMAARKGTRSRFRNDGNARVAPGPTSVLRCAPPSPGKCFTTGSTPAARRPDRKAAPYAATTDGSPLNERCPSASVELGPGLASTSSTGARSLVTPAARICRPTVWASARLCAGVIVPAIDRAHGIVATSPDSRCTPPPSSSAITNGRDAGAWAVRVRSRTARSCGGGCEPRNSTAPAPALTSGIAPATSKSRTGTAST